MSVEAFNRRVADDKLVAALRPYMDVFINESLKYGFPLELSCKTHGVVLIPMIDGEKRRIIFMCPKCEQLCLQLPAPNILP